MLGITKYLVFLPSFLHCDYCSTNMRRHYTTSNKTLGKTSGKFSYSSNYHQNHDIKIQHKYDVFSKSNAKARSDKIRRANFQPKLQQIYMKNVQSTSN